MIEFKKTGFDKLDEAERQIFDRLAADYSSKIERSIKNIKNLVINLREYHTSGKRRKYSFHAKVVIPGKDIEVSASEWDMAVTLHMLFKKILESAERNFRVSDQHKRRN